MLSAAARSRWTCGRKRHDRQEGWEGECAMTQKNSLSVGELYKFRWFCWLMLDHQLDCKRKLRQKWRTKGKLPSAAMILANILGTKPGTSRAKSVSSYSLKRMFSHWGSIRLIPSVAWAQRGTRSPHWPVCHNDHHFNWQDEFLVSRILVMSHIKCKFLPRSGKTLLRSTLWILTPMFWMGFPFMQLEFPCM